MPDIKTLVPDIYSLFDDEKHHEPSEENLQTLGRNLQELVRSRLSKRDDNHSVLRFSNLGRPDRQLWYQANEPEKGQKFSPKTLFKFLYGDCIELLLLFLAKEAGHEVTDEQRELEVEGVRGHIDAVIDGITVDVKSASPYSFKKFEDRSVLTNDPFGYVGQLSGYAGVVSPAEGGSFLVADKVHGDIALCELDADTVAQFELEKRIAHLKEVIAAPEPPPRCYPAEPEGKSGNMRLGINCSYCSHRDHCWSDSNGGKGLQVYNYYGGPKFFTHIEREPNTPKVETN